MNVMHATAGTVCFPIMWSVNEEGYSCLTNRSSNCTLQCNRSHDCSDGMVESQVPYTSLWNLQLQYRNHVIDCIMQSALDIVKQLHTSPLDRCLYSQCPTAREVYCPYAWPSSMH